MTRQIKSHKGGRTKRRPAVMTVETEANLNKLLAANGISFGDWIEQHVREDIDGLETDQVIARAYWVTEPILTGQMVIVNAGFHRVGLFQSDSSSQPPSGVALHDMLKDDMVEFDPLKNTKDFAVRLETSMPNCPSCHWADGKHKPDCIFG